MARTSDWGLEHVSPTMLSKFLTCRWQYWLRYGLHLKEPNQLWAPTGNTFHKTAYDFHQHPKTSIEDLLAMADAYWDDAVDGVEYFTFKGEAETAESVEAAKQDTMRWTEQYIVAVKDGDFDFVEFDGPPERDEEYPVEGTNHVMRGYIDAFPKHLTNLQTGEITDACNDGRIHILDFKLAGKKWKAWTQEKADAELQPTAYGYALGKVPIAMHYIIVEKTASHQKPSIKHFITYRDTRDYKQIESLVTAFEQATDRINKHQNGNFYPEPEFGFGRFCGKFCGFKDVCYKENFAHHCDADNVVAKTTEKEENDVKA